MELLIKAKDADRIDTLRNRVAQINALILAGEVHRLRKLARQARLARRGTHVMSSEAIQK